MLEFILISGLFTLGVKTALGPIMTKVAKDRGYVDFLYKQSTQHPKLKDRVETTVACFIPGLNLVLAAAMIATMASHVFSPNQSKDKKIFQQHLEMPAVTTNGDYAYLEGKLDGIEDALKLDGASPKMIKEETKKAEQEVYSNKVKLSDKKRREVEAMSETELWLRDLELTTGLSYKDRAHLFPDYTKDFMNEKENAKPKAIQKTLKMVNNSTK